MTEFGTQTDSDLGSRKSFLCLRRLAGPFVAVAAPLVAVGMVAAVACSSLMALRRRSGNRHFQTHRRSMLEPEMTRARIERSGVGAVGDVLFGHSRRLSASWWPGARCQDIWNRIMSNVTCLASSYFSSILSLVNVIINYSYTLEIVTKHRFVT